MTNKKILRERYICIYIYPEQRQKIIDDLRLMEYQYSSIFIWKHQEVYGNYYRDETALDNNNVFIDFPADDNNSVSFKFKDKK